VEGIGALASAESKPPRSALARQPQHDKGAQAVGLGDLIQIITAGFAAISNDRLSFMRFLGLGLEDRVPDARTIWLFREKLTTAGARSRSGRSGWRAAAPPISVWNSRRFIVPHATSSGTVYPALKSAIPRSVAQLRMRK
jgi:hypothetical protein